MHRKSGLVAVTAVALLFLAGCGGSAPVTVTPAPTPAPTPVIPSVLSALPGDWVALGAPTASGTFASPIASFSGAISVSGTTISGVFRAFTTLLVTGCPADTTAIPFTGTLDANNNLTLTAPLSGGVATISAALPQNLQTYIAGTYQVAGGTCSMPATVMKLVQFAPATGTYTGTYNAVDLTTNTPIPGTATAITAVLTQAATPAADGTFSLTGTVTSTGACAGKLAITAGTVSGGAVMANPPVLSAAPTGEFTGALNPTATTLTGGYSLFTGCGNQNYLGTLTRQ